MSESGFLDHQAAQAALALCMERYRLSAEFVESERAKLLPELEGRRASVVRRQAEILIELIDQRIQRARIIKQPFGAGLFGKLLRNLLHFVERAWPAQVKKPQHSDLEVLHEADLCLQLAEALFQHSFVELSIHGYVLGPIPFDQMADRIPVPGRTHRLSQGEK